MVLRHCGKLSKEDLLETIYRQSMKWRDSTIDLRVKIEAVKLSYRTYKKYRDVFETLGQRNWDIPRQRQFNLMAIFWVVYLFLKNGCE